MAKNGISVLCWHVLVQAYFFGVTANAPVTGTDTQEIKQQSLDVFYAYQGGVVEMYVPNSHAPAPSKKYVFTFSRSS